MRQSELDRRTFVMGSFGFGMAVLGGGMLAGCVAAEEQVEENEAPAPGRDAGADVEGSMFGGYWATCVPQLVQKRAPGVIGEPQA